MGTTLAHYRITAALLRRLGLEGARRRSTSRSEPVPIAP